MMRRAIAFLLACLMVASVAAAAADDSGIVWTDEERARLRVGNPTALQGKFFTTMWGGATSDLDVQSLLHAYSLVCYDIELSRFRFDHSVVQDAVAMDDEDGNRTYLLVLYDDLYWSDGTPITAADYAFSILFCMDPVIAETGGNPADYSWIAGSDEYLAHTSPTLSGLRVVTDQMLQVQVKAEAFPYFYELSRLMIHPYPVSVIAPGISVRDDGDGAYLSEPLTAEMINGTVLDEEQGYLSHPSVVSGPYVLTDYRWPTAELEINPYFKGTEDGTKPRIGEVEYTLAETDQMVESLVSGEYGLFNKITLSEKIQSGIQSIETENYAYSFESYARSGLTLLWFTESSPKVQEPEVRKAIAYCFDRDGFVRDLVAPYGLRVDGFYGLGQWMFRLASGQMGAPVDENLPEEERQAAVDAFKTVSLDNLTVYDVNLREADRLLETAGWRRNEQGIRCKTVDGETVELRLILGLPESAETRAALENNFVANLESVGVAVTLQPMGMDDIEKAYKGEAESADLLYFGEDFMIAFDPEILAPATEQADLSSRGSLPAVKAELYGLAVDMVRTDPADLLGFMQKWVTLQVRITETLPLLPVYSNVYFDFYSRELHDYRITKAITAGEAIVKSYMSDAELLGEDEIEDLQNEMTELEDSLETLMTEE